MLRTQEIHFLIMSNADGFLCLLPRRLGKIMATHHVSDVWMWYRGESRVTVPSASKNELNKRIKIKYNRKEREREKKMKKVRRN